MFGIYKKWKFLILENALEWSVSEVYGKLYLMWI